MIIDWYLLEKREDVFASILPQRYFSEKIDGLLVRFDTSKAVDLLAQFGNVAVVYNDVYIPAPSVKGGINVHFNGKYGVGYNQDGYLTLGIRRDEN